MADAVTRKGIILAGGMGYIDSEEVARLAAAPKQNGYAQYLLRLIGRGKNSP